MAALKSKRTQCFRGSFIIVRHTLPLPRVSRPPSTSVQLPHFPYAPPRNSSAPSLLKFLLFFLFVARSTYLSISFWAPPSMHDISQINYWIITSSNSQKARTSPIGFPLETIVYYICVRFESKFGSQEKKKKQNKPQIAIQLFKSVFWLLR